MRRVKCILLFTHFAHHCLTLEFNHFDDLCYICCDVNVIDGCVISRFNVPQRTQTPSAKNANNHLE